MFSTNKNILNKSFCFSKLCLLFFIIFSFSTGCKSVKLPENVSKPLDYTDDDVVKNEIKNIYAMLETLPVKALWRACILGDAEVKAKCQEAVKNQLLLAVQEERYYDAARYEKSLAVTGYAIEDEEI